MQIQLFSRRPSASVTKEAAPLASPAPSAAVDDRAIALVRRWRELSELERRAFGAVTRELSMSSAVVEQATLDLSGRFQALASIAEAQSGRMDRIISAASAIEVDGETMSLDAALGTVGATLSRAVENVLFVTQHATRMVETLDDVARDVAAAEQCSGQIEVINKQARYLALNAAIEATRSGAAGAAFNVIAHEMKQLALATETTSVQVRERIASVTEGVRRGHEVMHDIATMDLSVNNVAKERINVLLAGIRMQHTRFGDVLGETARASAEVADTIDELITGIQFQDRTKQQVAQVVDTLDVLRDGIIVAQQDTDAAFPGLFQPGDLDQAALERIVAKQTLGAMKARILARLLGPDSDASGVPEDQPEAETGAGEVELF